MRYTTAGMPPLDDALLSLAILLVAALVQGFFGFGFGILAMGGLTLSQDLIHASGLVNITAVVVMVWLTFQLRHHILRRLTFRMLAPVLLGVFLGVIALGRVERDLMVSILGATIVARHAGEMISEITLAMVAGLGLAKVFEVIHPYPTQAMVLKANAGAYLRTRLTPKAKRIFELWFRLTG